MIGPLYYPFLMVMVYPFCVLAAGNPSPRCRYLPGDDQWPDNAQWAALNQSLGGRLIATVPQASVCHNIPYLHYDRAACQALASTWDSAQTLYVDLLISGFGNGPQEHKIVADNAIAGRWKSLPHPAEIINPFFQNQSCDPFTPYSQKCDLGNYAVYSINVTGPEDVARGIQFAKTNNVRLVIKNTGHE